MKPVRQVSVLLPSGIIKGNLRGLRTTLPIPKLPHPRPGLPGEVERHHEDTDSSEWWCI